MAYIPPHKRHLKEGSTSSSSSTPSPTPIPESLLPHFKRGLNFKNFSENKKKDKENATGSKIVYDPDATSKWFPVGLADDDDYTLFGKLALLETVSLDSLERRGGTKPLTLVLDRDRLKECSEGRKVFVGNPWALVAANVKKDFLLALERVKSEMGDEHEVAKPTLVARFGKVLFRGSPPTGESGKWNTLHESLVKKLRRSFHTNVSASYMDYIVSDAVPKLGVDFEAEKDIFHVKLSDNMRPDSTISCKCTWSKNYERLELFKIEWNQVRHLVVDISLLDQKTDLRLMLCMKRIIVGIGDDEMKCIKDLVSSAIFDPEVKGGLRWPLGKESSGDRYTVVGVWHTKAKTFRNLSIRLKARHADRFDFITSFGEVTREVSVKMPNIISEMHGQRINEERVGEILEKNLQLLWDACLCYESEPSA